VLWKTPVFARVTETTAGDIEFAQPRCGRRADENRDQRGQNRQSAAVQKSKDERETAEDFQPWQIKCESRADKPRQRFVIVDVQPETNGIKRLNYTGVNENPANDQIDGPPNESWHG